MTENDRFINIKEVQTFIGLRHNMIYQMVKAGTFPRPIKLGTASRWSLRAVQEWMAAQIKAAA